MNWIRFFVLGLWGFVAIVGVLWYIAYGYLFGNNKWLPYQYSWLNRLFSSRAGFLAGLLFMYALNTFGTETLLSFISDDWGRIVDDEFVSYKTSISYGISFLFSAVNIGAFYYADKYFASKNKEDPFL